ncbi:hypothetical protein Taro_044707, partial [Colocasia esculenta]|nr:hypothetical protein [Colocasia esculenta]
KGGPRKRWHWPASSPPISQSTTTFHLLFPSRNHSPVLSCCWALSPPPPSLQKRFWRSSASRRLPSSYLISSWRNYGDQKNHFALSSPSFTCVNGSCNKRLIWMLKVWETLAEMKNGSKLCWAVCPSNHTNFDIEELSFVSDEIHGFHSPMFGKLDDHAKFYSLLPSKYENLSTIKFQSQTRWASQSAAARYAAGDGKITIGPKSEGIKEDEKEPGVVYYGPISSTIKKVKLLSLSTCCLSVSLGPVITFMTSPDMNVILKGAVASTVIFLSASTTAALHWFVSPYVHKLRWKPGSESFEAEMMSWLATPLPRTVKFANIRPAETNRPFVTFKADGDFYFVDVEHFNNKALLARLTPQKPSYESALKNL